MIQATATPPEAKPQPSQRNPKKVLAWFASQLLVFCRAAKVFTHGQLQQETRRILRGRVFAEEQLTPEIVSSWTMRGRSILLTKNVVHKGTRPALAPQPAECLAEWSLRKQETLGDAIASVFDFLCGGGHRLHDVPDHHPIAKAIHSPADERSTEYFYTQIPCLGGTDTPYPDIATRLQMSEVFSALREDDPKATINWYCDSGARWEVQRVTHASPFKRPYDPPGYLGLDREGMLILCLDRRVLATRSDAQIQTELEAFHAAVTDCANLPRKKVDELQDRFGLHGLDDQELIDELNQEQLTAEDAAAFHPYEIW